MESSQTEIMTIEDVAKYLRIPVSSAYKLAQEGKIPCQKVGRHWRFHKQALEKWFEKHPTDELEKINHSDKEGFIDQQG